MVKSFLLDTSLSLCVKLNLHSGKAFPRGLTRDTQRIADHLCIARSFWDTNLNPMLQPRPREAASDGTALA
jgi:hypothetical protein